MPRSTRSVAYVGRRSEPLPDDYVIPASVLEDDRKRLEAQAVRKASQARLSSPDRSIRVKGSSPSPWAGHARPRDYSPCLTAYIQAVQDREPGDPRPEPPGQIVTRQDRQGRTAHVLVTEPLK